MLASMTIQYKNINLKNKKVLVTGADGFIGSHLVEALLKEGSDIRAMAMYNSFNNWGWLDHLDKKTLQKIEVYPGDMRDRKSVDNACKDIDIVFHLASLIAIPQSYYSPYAYLETNATGALNLFESCLNSKVEKIIHTSTSEVYGEYDSVPISELNKNIARSPYSASKIAADQLAYSYYSTFDLPVSIIRPFNTFGPRQSNRAIIPTIITQILNDKLINLGSLYPTRDFTNVSDTVSGFISIAQNKKSIGEIINIGSGYEISIENLVKLIQSVMKSNLVIKTDKKRERPVKGEVFRLKADISKASKLINWQPSYKGKKGLEKGLKETIEWFSNKENLRFYKSSIYNK